MTAAIPLILSSVHPPKRYFKAWLVMWILFNATLGILMGVYHQGGIVPTQNYLVSRNDLTEVLWWKTYSPPTWLLDGKNEHVRTVALMGMPPELMLAELTRTTPCSRMDFNNSGGTYLVAPYSATFLDGYDSDTTQGLFHLESVWKYHKHLNLDDLDFSEDGIWPTLKRVIGRRGLITWNVIRHCS
ncbi:MAG: alpha 1,2 mannosyltransferase [Peltula sp. TS41687]|nr:MAG: alpha 1,2 mannosyltransferase [Peltula sp. TS41687]